MTLQTEILEELTAFVIAIFICNLPIVLPFF
jgi:hypothetical protein